MERRELVWCPDPLEGYVLGHVTDFNGETLTIELAGRSAKTVDAFYDDVFPALDEVLSSYVDDNCSLVYLNEATLLQNIRLRYSNDLIYTYVANILIAVNPYKIIPGMYSAETAKKYKGKSLGVLPPHVFAIGDKIYRDMKSNRKSQSIVVSGESGAGKTETTKHILRYLTESYGASSGIIERRIVEANPLLESLGNSRTMRNVNSSRFGKFVEMHFDHQFNVVGGHISHYLLEKSRVCTQSERERNYHIFYHMLAGAPRDMRQALMLDDSLQYEYLANRTLESLDHDKQGYSALVSSMKCIGMDDQERAHVFTVVAAVLHLGNIMFDQDHTEMKGGSVIKPKSMSSLRAVSSLLSIDHEDLQRCLTYRVMTTTKKGAIGTVINVPLKPEQAANARDALAKAIYVKLFDWVVKRVNECFPCTSSKYSIGVLDIAGFEYYQLNSFEQFCINYCNEKLQQLFNERVIKEEQDLYKREGLGSASTRYVDNQDCIDLIELKGSGIIDLLDEECRIPRGSNEHFTSTVHSTHKNHFRLLSPRQSKLPNLKTLRDDEAFIIRHFAGAVCYKTSGFLDKNNDSLHGSLEQLMATSRDAFTRGLLISESQHHMEDNPTGSYAKKLILDSVSSKFKTQLNGLMDKLRQTETSFIHCIKPNLSMLPGKFNGGQVLSQLKCGGTVAVLKLMEGGYPSRTQFTDLYNTYESFLPVSLARLDPRTFCEALFRAIGFKPTEFKFGNNKVFFKAGKFAEFDQLMHKNPESLKTMIAKVKHWLVRKQWRKVIYGAIAVQKLSRKIQWRDSIARVLQSWMKMQMVVLRYRPRYQCLVKLNNLMKMMVNLRLLANGLSIEKEKVLKQLEELDVAVKREILNIKSTVNSRTKIEERYKQIEDKVLRITNEIQARQEQEKVVEEERQKMKELKTIQELEKKKRNEELLRKKRGEAMKEKEKQWREEARKQSTQSPVKANQKHEQEQADRQLAVQLQAEESAKEVKRIRTLEQERRDFELALRLAQSESEAQTVISGLVKHRTHEHVPVIHKPPVTAAAHAIQATIKQYDLTKWSYPQLRDSINTSCDMNLLNACKDELHRRLKVYHSWRAKNTPQQPVNDDMSTLRAPIIQENLIGPTSTEPEQVEQDRYFRVPFLRPSAAEQMKKGRGWWYAHFKGQWIVRQLELYPNTAPLLLVAGKDDLEMCELSLEETGLTRKKGAEITVNQFEEAWRKCTEGKQTKGEASAL